MERLVLTVSRASKKLAAAHVFMNYTSSPEIQAKWHQDTGYLPITVEAGELTRSQGFYDANPGTDIAVIQMTAKEPTNNSKGLRLGSFDQIRGIIDEELEAVWAGDKDAQAALDSAVARGSTATTTALSSSIGCQMTRSPQTTSPRLARSMPRTAPPCCGRISRLRP